MAFSTNPLGNGPIDTDGFSSAGGQLTLNLSADSDLNVPTSGTLATTLGVGSAGYVRIARVVTASSTSVIEFDSIPGTYSHLRIMLVGVNVTGEVNADCRLNINDITDNFYFLAGFYENDGDGPPGIAVNTSDSAWSIGPLSNDNVNNTPSVTIIDLPFYSNDTWGKTAIVNNGYCNSSNNRVSYYALTSQLGDIISKITISSNEENFFLDGTICDLYGLN